MAEDDEEFDPRKAPETAAGWHRLNNGAEKGAKAWTIVAPFYIVITNWKIFAAAIIASGFIIRFVRPDIWAALVQMPGVGQ